MTPLAPPSHMSELTPGLALVWDSSALGDLMFCPEKYRLAHREGWRGSSVDLEFGGYFAQATERYKRGRLNGEDKLTATIAATRKALEDTWHDGTPWGGQFEPQWHCKGTEPYKNARGNRAKCPYAHKGVWFPDEPPGICGECGSDIETQWNFISDHYAKNRMGLVRAITWWCDEQPQVLADGVHPYTFPDGKVAVELFVAAPLPFTTKKGERYVLSGHLDEISEFADELFVSDNKTTKKPLDEDFFSSYAPNIQFDTYDLLARTVFPDLPIQGVVIDAIQLLKEAVRTGKHIYYKTEAQREEHLKMIGFWLTQAEIFAEHNYYPMNKRNCGFCHFRRICALSPEDRPRALEQSSLTKQEPWSPISRR